MNIASFKETRLFRVVSHNGNSSSLNGPPSASNFNVVIGGDMSKLGEVAAFSLESISFPNLFPNVVSVDGNNELLFRQDTPDVDSLELFVGDSFTFQFPSSEVVTISPAPVTTTNACVASMAAASVPYMNVTSNAFGAVFFESLVGPLLLTDPAWNRTWGIPLSQTGVQRTSWAGYPAGVGYIGTSPFFTLTIPQGFYNQDQLATMIQNTLQANLDPNFIVTVQTIGQDNVLQIQDLFNPFMLSPREPPMGDPINYRQLPYQLGFSVFPDTPQNIIRALNNPALQGEQVVYLFSNALSSQKKAYSGEGPQDDMIATIPMFAGYGEINEVILNSWADPAIVYERGYPPRFFDFSLRNQYNELLDIGWNQTLSMSFRLFFR